MGTITHENYSTESNSTNYLTDFEETGSYFMAKIVSGFPSDVLRLLCVNSVIYRVSLRTISLLAGWTVSSEHCGSGSVCTTDILDHQEEEVSRTGVRANAEPVLFAQQSLWT